MAKRIKVEGMKKRRAERALGIPDGFGPKIELMSNREATVDDCKGIIEYYEDRIKINLGKGTVTFTGSGLHIGAMTEKGAVITGTIVNIEFCV